MVAQGQIWWAELPTPMGSEPGFRRPFVVVQSDSFNRTRLRTVVCVALTSNPGRASGRGNVTLPASLCGLPQDSVAVVTQISTLDRGQLTECISELPDWLFLVVLRGAALVLGLE